jgi:hypothetical protein
VTGSILRPRQIFLEIHNHPIAECGFQIADSWPLGLTNIHANGENEMPRRSCPDTKPPTMILSLAPGMGVLKFRANQMTLP